MKIYVNGELMTSKQLGAYINVPIMLAKDVIDNGLGHCLRRNDLFIANSMNRPVDVKFQFHTTKYVDPNEYTQIHNVVTCTSDATINPAAVERRGGIISMELIHHIKYEQFGATHDCEQLVKMPNRIVFRRSSFATMFDTLSGLKVKKKSFHFIGELGLHIHAKWRSDCIFVSDIHFAAFPVNSDDKQISKSKVRDGDIQVPISTVRPSVIHDGDIYDLVDDKSGDILREYAANMCSNTIVRDCVFMKQENAHVFEKVGECIILDGRVYLERKDADETLVSELLQRKDADADMERKNTGNISKYNMPDAVVDAAAGIFLNGELYNLEDLE